MASPSASRLKRRVPAPNLFVLDEDGQLPWLTSLQIEDACERAREEAAEGTARAVHFCGQLLCTTTDLSGYGEDRSTEAKHNIARIHKAGPDTRTLAWLVNRDVMDASEPNGSHWCLALLELPKRIADLHATPGAVECTLHYFDSLGGRIRRAQYERIDFLVKKILPRRISRMGRPRSAPGDRDPLRSVRMQITRKTVGLHAPQKDGYQCGVWAIWYLKEYLAVRQPDPARMSQPPRRPRAFRRLYFSRASSPLETQDDVATSPAAGSTTDPVVLFR